MQTNDVTDVNYLRSIFLVHMPWYGSFKIKTDSPNLKVIFQNFLNDKNKCPECVRFNYFRAINANRMFNEPVSSKEDIDYDNFAYKNDPNIQEIVGIAGTFATNINNIVLNEFKYDYVLNYNWIF